MIFQAIKSAWPGPVDEGGADREWNCLLACGHERKLFGSRSPRNGRAFAACDQPLCGADSDALACEQVQESNPEPGVTRGDSKQGAGRKRAPTANEQILTDSERPGYSSEVLDELVQPQPQGPFGSDS